jgi:hypothetical protein
MKRTLSKPDPYQMSQRAIHRIEQGHSEPRRTTLPAIESLLRKAAWLESSRIRPLLGQPTGPRDVARPDDRRREGAWNP